MTPTEFKNHRLDLGYEQQKQLAKDLEVDPSTIQKIESGQRKISKALLFRYKHLILMNNKA